MTDLAGSTAAVRVLLVGVGGLGAPAAWALGAMGRPMELIVADDDVVELSNLHRQILFRESDVGRSKVRAAQDRLNAAFPWLVVTDGGGRFVPERAAQLLASADVVVEGSDNFATKFLVADAARRARRPVVHGAAVRWYGTVLGVGPTGVPCYRCLFEDTPEDQQLACDAAGVMGPVLGVLGAVMADWAVGLTQGAGAGRIFALDGKALTSRVRSFAARTDCPCQGVP
jgi:molybdopterin/thiamine biosynthesis adenylyltransferase